MSVCVRECVRACVQPLAHAHHVPRPPHPRCASTSTSTSSRLAPHPCPPKTSRQGIGCSQSTPTHIHRAVLLTARQAARPAVAAPGSRVSPTSSPPPMLRKFQHPTLQRAAVKAVAANDAPPRTCTAQSSSRQRQVARPAVASPGSCVSPSSSSPPTLRKHQQSPGAPSLPSKEQPERQWPLPKHPHAHAPRSPPHGAPSRAARSGSP